MTKPEPSEATLRSPPPRPPPRLEKKSSKNSSNGEPFGTRGKGTPSEPLTVCDVEILTTASISRSASGAIDVGPPRVCALDGAIVAVIMLRTTRPASVLLAVCAVIADDVPEVPMEFALLKDLFIADK